MYSYSLELSSVELFETQLEWGFPCGVDGKGSACSVGGLVGRSPEEGMARHSSVLAWRIPWIEEAGGPPSAGSQRVGHAWGAKHSPVSQSELLQKGPRLLLLDAEGQYQHVTNSEQFLALRLSQSTRCELRAQAWVRTGLEWHLLVQNHGHSFTQFQD